MSASSDLNFEEPDEALNYHHLRYFWLVVREGSVVAAARKLGVSQPAVSGQISLLEQAMGQPLFERRGRLMTLTERGKLVFDYAQRIFSLGQELITATNDRQHGVHRLSVGVVPSLPSGVLTGLLRTLRERKIQFVCSLRRHAELVAEMAIGKLDLFISDVPAGADMPGNLTSRQIGEFEIAMVAGRPLARQLTRDFPASLNGAPLLLPATDQPIRSHLDKWLTAKSLHPAIVGDVCSADLLLSMASTIPAVAATYALANEPPSEGDLMTIGKLETTLPITIFLSARALRLGLDDLHP